MQLNHAAESIISNILSEKEVVEKIYDIKERSADIYEHSISITSLAILIALKLSLSHEDIHDIGVACLLHDIGLRYLTIDYINKEKSVKTLYKRIVLLCSIIVITTVYVVIGYEDYATLFNSAICAPVFYSWVLRPILIKCNIGYKKYDDTLN